MKLRRLACFSALALMLASAATNASLIVESPTRVEVGSLVEFKVTYALDWSTMGTRATRSHAEFYGPLDVIIDESIVTSLARPSPSNYSLNPAIPALIGGTFFSEWAWEFQHYFIDEGVFDVVLNGNRSRTNGARARYWEQIPCSGNCFALLSSGFETLSGRTQIEVFAAERQIPVPATIYLVLLGLVASATSRNSKPVQVSFGCRRLRDRAKRPCPTKQVSA